MRDMKSPGTTTLVTLVLTWLCAGCTTADPPGDGDGVDAAPAAGGSLPGGGAPGPDQGPPPAPVAEPCDGLDNDGDGAVDESGCPCTADLSCFAGPASARGIGACRDGVRACEANNEFFGPCVGSVGPTAETCGDGIDDDCDGRVDECCAGDCIEPDGGATDPGRPDAGQPGDQPGDGPGVGDGAEEFIVGEDRAARPVDFIMIVDNSGSMDDTVARVEGNLGTFATRLVQAGIDYRFALISERGTGPRDPDVCIPPPMAALNCGDTDRFIHRDQRIDSEDGFERLLECFDQCDDGAPSIRGFLRPGALLQLIMVTDDESDLPWPEFRAELAAIGFPDFILHGVVGLVDEDCVADRGDQYIQGAQETGGELLDICSQDWGRVLDVILDATVTQLQRTFVLTGTPRPETLRVLLATAGGPPVEQVGNWRFDAAQNTITFTPDAVLPVGARVLVRYTRR